MALDISIDALGIHRQGKTVDLSPLGTKVAVPAYPIEQLWPGTRAELRLALPAGESLALTATVVRTEPDGIALKFGNSESGVFTRLKDLVDALLRSRSNDPARLHMSVGMSVGPVKDRRRAPRAAVQLDINFDADRPRYWQGKTIDLSPFGMKVAWPATVPQPLWGTGVRLRIAAPDGQPPLSLKGIVWRREPQSIVLLFVELGREETERLKALVEFLQACRVEPG